jgi:hypothetical protein
MMSRVALYILPDRLSALTEHSYILDSLNITLYFEAERPARARNPEANKEDVASRETTSRATLT